VKFALPHMGRGGVIIATSSPGGRQATAGGVMMAYSSSKAGLDMFVHSAALDLAAHGIRVCGLLPGLTRTEIAGVDMSEESWLAALTSTGTSRPPSDLVTAYQFLASDAAHMLQGAIIAADDGCSAGLSMPVLRRLMGTPANA
jgi:NAD(P)-dependent dehydrogenase (short-subunit alcohol dehydrogenase family)